MTHPLVGVWIVEVEDATRSRVTHGFRADGTMLVTSAFHGAQGVWRQTGERSAEVVVMRPIEAEDRSFVGWQTASGSLELSEDGESYEMSGSVSRPLPGGGFDERPLNLRAVRLKLE
jgi:hypothetical protein